MLNEDLVVVGQSQDGSLGRPGMRRRAASLPGRKRMSGGQG